MELAAASPGYWDDPREAQRKMQELGRIKETVNVWRNLQSKAVSLLELTAMAIEEGDESLQDELVEEGKEISDALSKQEVILTLSGPYDERSAIVSIHAGVGGTDSQDWAEMLLRMYLRWGEAHGFKTEVMEVSEGEVAGVKGATIRLEGEYAFGWLRTETGVHRLVRKSPFDSGNRRHTSFASVFVSPELDDDIDIELDMSQVRVDTYRASGAGGQHVNKTDSAIRLTHEPTGIVVQCQNQRSQHKNKDQAMKLLRARLYEQEMLKRKEKQQTLEDSKADIGWGSQIRSYVLDQSRIKDLRTNVEIGNTQAVLDGALDPFIEASLKQGL